MWGGGRGTIAPTEDGADRKKSVRGRHKRHHQQRSSPQPTAVAEPESVVWCGVVWCGVVWCGLSAAGGLSNLPPPCPSLSPETKHSRSGDGDVQGEGDDVPEEVKQWGGEVTC